jgi:hypothetical protein
MRPALVLRLLVLVPLVLAAGCSSKNHGKIEGTSWRSDAATVKGRDFPAGYLQLEFRADGGLVYRAGGRTFTGKYLLGPGNVVTFNLEQDLAGKKIHVETVAVHEDRMKVSDADGTEMTFRKQK